MVRRLLVLALGLWATTAWSTAFAQPGNPCAKLLLFPLHDPSLALAESDRSFFTLHELCSAGLVSEGEARDSGLDVKLAYAYARIPASDATRFDQLRAWLQAHCAEYAAPQDGARLSSITNSILARQSEAVRREYERCTTITERPACHAVPVGADAVALLVLPAAPPESKEPPRIVEARVAGALLPDTFHPSYAGGEQLPVTVESLANVPLPEGGLLRLFARRTGASAVLFDVRTNAGKCSTQEIAPLNRDNRIYSIRSQTTPWNPESKDHRPCYFKLGDDLWVDVANLPKAVETLAAQKRIAAANAGIGDLVPIIDGHALVGVHPTNPASVPDPVPLDDGQPVHHLKFHLERNDANKQAWSHLLNDPLPFQRRVEFTLGFENGAALDTWVTKDGTDPESQAFLIVVPGAKAGIGGMIIGTALLVFLFLAGRTDIVRDTTAPLRPDERHPYSLAKTQMAFWFFIVISAYFVLWMITGDKDTITNSVVVLIGISAGTALGAAVVDASKSSGEDVRKFVASDLPADPKERAQELHRRQRSAEDDLARLAAERARLKEREELSANEQARAAVLDRLHVIKRQREFFSFPAWKRVLYDLLGENYLISFHRFQIFIWTLVLGVIFVSSVLHDLAMPDFSPTLLAIMGISGGTYIGFKLPEQKVA